MSIEQEHPRPDDTTAQSKDGNIDWGAAFQSPEFLTGLQTAMVQTFGRVSAPPSSVSSQVAQLEQLGEPSRNQARTKEAQPGSGAFATRYTTGTPGARESGRLFAPCFLATMGEGPASDGENARTEGGLLQNMGQSDPNQGAINIDNATLSGADKSLYRPTLGSEKAFMLGPGRAPIPAKLVTQIVSHKYIELSELSPDNLEESTSEVMSFSIEGSTIVPCSKVNPRKKQDALDILTWVECFNCYAAVISSFFRTELAIY